MSTERERYELPPALADAAAGREPSRSTGDIRPMPNPYKQTDKAAVDEAVGRKSSTSTGGDMSGSRQTEETLSGNYQSMTLRARFARRLRFTADRIDNDNAFRHMTILSVALEPGRGWVLRQDGTGIPVWYRTPDYARADELPRGPMTDPVGQVRS